MPQGENEERLSRVGGSQGRASEKKQPWKALFQQIKKGDGEEDLITVPDLKEGPCNTCGQDPCTCGGIFLAA